MAFQFPTRISYSQLLSKFDSYFPKWIKHEKQQLSENLLLAIGYNCCDFKLGETQVFFRPEKFILFEKIEKTNSVVKEITDRIKFSQCEINEQTGKLELSRLAGELSIAVDEVASYQIEDEVLNCPSYNNENKPDVINQSSNSRFCSYFIAQMPD